MHNTTPGERYLLFSTEDLFATWKIERDFLGAPDQDFTQIVVQMNGRVALYLRASTAYDLDGNGIPDPWERLVAHAVIGTLDPYADPDNDGWSNIQEYQNNTNPNSLPGSIDTPPPPQNMCGFPWLDKPPQSPGTQAVACRATQS